MINQTIRAQDAPGDAAMRAMFAARKQVFIDILKWDLPVLAGQYELDQFDIEEARYLILLDADRRHRASTRLLPTSAPHLLGDLYPDLCAGPLPSAPTIWEISRFCLDPAQSASERRDARNQLVTALAGYALRQGITDYVGVAERRWFEQIRAFGWNCRALGAPRNDGCGEILALHIRIDHATLASLERAGVYAPLALRLEECGEVLP